MPGSTIFIIGFMGAGKTTFGKKLSAKLKYRFVDLDAEVVKQYQANSITGLIDGHGIDFFREAERDALRELNLHSAVVATGGGTPCYFDNMPWMKEHGTVVFLDVDEKSLFNRLKTTNLHERPLLRGLDDEGLKQFIHEKLEQRMAFYKLADIAFNPVQYGVDELVALLG